MIADMLAFAKEHSAQGRRVALVTVTETSGSSPASAGQMMVVLADGSCAGTIGGGASEFDIKQKAMQAINNGEKVIGFSLDHAQSGMVCGGSMQGFINILGEENCLYIFGGGHISQCLAPLASATGFFVTVIEDRPEYAKDFSNVQYVVCKPENFDKELHIAGSAFAVICTRGHSSDEAALRFCLSLPLKYTGMIGSAQKVAESFERLRQEGYTEEIIKTIYAPIGLDIASAVPAEIAVAILAEMLLVKNGGTLRHKKEKLP